MNRVIPNALRTIAVITMLWPVAAAAQESVLLDDMVAPGGWQPEPWNKAPGELSVSNEFPTHLSTAQGEPRQSLAAKINWPGGKEFRFFNILPTPAPDAIPFAATHVSLWVKGSGTGHHLELSFKDREGENVKIGLGTLDFSDWRKLRAGVPDNHAQPLRLSSITIHGWDNPYADETTVHLARLRVLVDREQPLADIPDAPGLSARALHDGGLVPDDGNATLRLRVFGWSDASDTFVLRHSITDWSGKSQQLQPIQVRYSGDWRRDIALSLPAFGPFVYRAELTRPGEEEPLAGATQRLLRVVPVERLSAEDRARSHIGVNVHVAARWELLARCGVHWARDYTWGWLGHGETAPVGNGVDFAQVWRRAEDAGVTILPITMAAFRNEEDDGFITDSAVIEAGYKRLAAAFPRVPCWELDNEAEYHFPAKRFDEDNYNNLISSAARGVRSAGAARIALNGTAGIRYEDSRKWVSGPARDDFDVVNYHYYTGTVPPEIAKGDINVAGGREQLTFVDQLVRINRLAHEAGKEGWLTELGWDVTFGPAVGDKLQAIYLVRGYLIARWTGTDKTFWYYDRDVAGSTTRFATCGLYDLTNALRPSAAAMAQLSRETALATPGGSVDLGDDIWCLLFEEPGGEWVAAAWTVRQPHPVPEELVQVPATDMFGNEVTPRQLTGEVHYFHLDRLPPAWEAQRHARWLSPSILFSAPGEQIKVQAAAGSGKLDWAQLPAGITAGDWVEVDDHLECLLTCAPELAEGRTEAIATATGDGWQRNWTAELTIEPAVTVVSQPYEPGRPTDVAVSLATSTDRRITISLPPGVAADAVDFDLAASQTRTVKLTMPQGSVEPLPVDIALDSGVRTRTWLRPRRISATPADAIAVDGDLSDWNAARAMDSRTMERSVAVWDVNAWIGASEEGLLVAGRLPVRDLHTADPRAFWDWTNMELFVNPADAAQGEALEKTHQFWFTPVREEKGWRLYAGEWKRGAGVPATIYDDTRCRTAVLVTEDSVSMEALIPWSALGRDARPHAETWLCAVALQGLDRGSQMSAGWPMTKERGLLRGTDNWGTLAFD